MMISAFFWDITQHIVVISYRHFGTTYRSHIQGSRNPYFLTFEGGIIEGFPLLFLAELLGFLICYISNFLFSYN